MSASKDYGPRRARNIAGWIEGQNYAKHVFEVTREDARGVLKRPRNLNDETAVKRFHLEAKGMAALVGRPGIMPVLDRGDTPWPWYVTEQATLLADHLGDQPNLRDVIGAIADLADTLADLQQDGIAHRDIKPQNLFWFNGRAVFGDFGIATWPDREEGLTQLGRNVGAAHFLAPEQRAHQFGTDEFAADIWALIKTLHVLANSLDGPYPPGGTHHHGVPDFSLRDAGGAAAAELEWLLEACTATDPKQRPTATELAFELRTWLERHPEGTVHRHEPPADGFARFGDPNVRARWRQFREVIDLVEVQVMRAAIAIGEPVDDQDVDIPSAEKDYPYEDAVDHFVSRASALTAYGRRAAFAALMWMDGTEFRVEIQQVGADGSIMVLGRCLGERVHPEWPSGRRVLDDLVGWARNELNVSS